MFTSILSEGTTNLTIIEGLICTGVSLLLGLWISLVYSWQGNSSRNFRVTIALLPALVQLVIMMVNGNLGTGVAVLGTFSLIRFRSVPGSSREIISVFFAMAIGLATGMGFLTFSCFIAFVIGLVSLLLYKVPFGNGKPLEKDLRITIPENLDYTEVFDDIFDRYLKQVELIRVKTINLGSMFEIFYHVTIKDQKAEKQMIDELRCRNGNLCVIVAKRQAVSDEL